MITRNQRMGPRKSFPTHQRSTTSKNWPKIRKTDDGVEHPTTKTTEAPTSGARTKDWDDSEGIRKISLRKNCRKMTTFLLRYQLRQQSVSLFWVLCDHNYRMKCIMMQYPSFKGMQKMDARWIVAKTGHVSILSSCSREDLIGQPTGRRPCANSAKRQRIRWSINMQ